MNKGSGEFGGKKILLSDLIDTNIPQNVIGEVKIIISITNPGFDFRQLYRVFYDVVRLYNGEFPGYRSCNTEYHDLKHTLDIILAMARLIHGYLRSGNTLSENAINLGLITALMHDTGYIQTCDDNDGTGAKYTLEHLTRSAFFIEQYFALNGFSKDDFLFCKNCIMCTGMNRKIDNIKFSSHEEMITGKILGTANLLGHMADRYYLEKLLFLYYEFKEGNVLGYENELDLLKKTLNVYMSTMDRFSSEFDNLNDNLVYHFKDRWNLDQDLYKASIDKNINYLHYLLDNHEKDYRDHLRRGKILEKLQERGLHSNV